MGRFYQLSRPVAYLFVQGPNLSSYRFYAPAVITVVLVIIYNFLPVKLILVGQESLASYFASFFVTLPGFFIAALAAIVAFSGGDLDEQMPGVKVVMESNGDRSAQDISLRIFLCYLFSYLTVISFVGFFVCILGNLLSSNVLQFVKNSNKNNIQLISDVISSFYFGIVIFIGASVVSCTMQGLYFLAERVHQRLK